MIQLSWEALGAIFVIISLLVTLCYFVLKITIRDEVFKAFREFQLNFCDKRCGQLEKSLSLLEIYAHSRIHEIANKAQINLAGREI